MIYILLILAIFNLLSILAVKRKIRKTIKYQNFKTNILWRIVFKNDFDEHNRFEKSTEENPDPDWYDIASNAQHEVIQRIKRQVNDIADQEIANDSSWEDTLKSFESECRLFSFDSSYPFYQIFDRQLLEKLKSKYNVK